MKKTKDQTNEDQPASQQLLASINQTVHNLTKPVLEGISEDARTQGGVQDSGGPDFYPQSDLIRNPGPRITPIYPDFGAMEYNPDTPGAYM